MADGSGRTPGGSGSAVPTPEEVGASYDEFGDLYAMTLGDHGLHIGMWTPPGERAAASTLTDLSNLAQDRQTDFLIDTIGLRPGEHLLDIGCGDGQPAIRLARRSGGRVTGITVSESQRLRAQESLRGDEVAESVEFAYGNAMDLAYGDGEFDAAWGIDSFTHFADRPAGLREAWRVLRPGGHFLMTEFTEHGAPAAEQRAAFGEVWTSPPPKPLTTLLEEVSLAGFETLRVESLTQNFRVTSELMYLLFTDRHEDIRKRYGDQAAARMDTAMPLLRSYCFDHIRYFLLHLRKPVSPDLSNPSIV